MFYSKNRQIQDPGLPQPSWPWPRRSRRAAAIAEFGPAVFIFILVMALPVSNLICFGLGYAAISTLTSQCVLDAATASSFKSARERVLTRARQMQHWPVCELAKLKANGGLEGSGVDIYITQTELSRHEIREFGPNTGLTVPIDESKNIYEFTVKSNFFLGPFINLGLPVPFLGAPVAVQVVSHKAVEHSGSMTMKPGRVEPHGQCIDIAKRSTVKLPRAINFT